jgi:GTPase
LISEERVIVDDVEGTTRDSIDSIIKINDKTYRFIDTAGIRRDKFREEELEYYSKLGPSGLLKDLMSG